MAYAGRRCNGDRRGRCGVAPRLRLPGAAAEASRGRWRPGRGASGGRGGVRRGVERLRRVRRGDRTPDLTDPVDAHTL
ncbi:hypothetical protein ACRAWF_18500 [Streptomyces sp. L7]